MADAPNLTTILRQQSKLGPINVPRAAMRDAADHIEALERQIAELRAEVERIHELYGFEQRGRLAAEAENARLRALPLKDEVERVLPAIPDDDSDFTPDLARKIISQYQALLRETEKV